MITPETYAANLALAEHAKKISGVIVECGVWRGGMSAGLAEILGAEREYYLFDSFEGLPPAKDIDGPAAQAWQQDKSSPNYHDNCTASQAEAEATLKRSPARNVHLIAGWFNETLPHSAPDKPIALLRLDSDWYDSTMTCLETLYPRVAMGGLVIIDDYYAWDGCSRAVHDYFSRHQLPVRLREHFPSVAYFFKG